VTEPDIPIVFAPHQLPEQVIGVASTTESAERLLTTLAPNYPEGTVYMDCARTPEQVRAEAREVRQ
jgi:hypothetical protein